MRARTTLLMASIALTAVSSAHAQAYKWRDEHGTVTYGQQPPGRVRAVPIDIQPNGAPSTTPRDCAGVPCVASPVASGARGAEPERDPRPVASSQPAVRGLDFDVYIRLKAGMSEGELLQRAGPPDFESVENARGLIAKSYYYYPTTSNPFTTIVSVRGGRISNIERVKRF